MSTTDTSVTEDTRRKSGRLSTKTVVYFNDDEEIDQDIEPVPAAAPDIEEPATPTSVAFQALITQPKRIFESFSTKSKLQDGFCIVRKLRNGRYELVNLSQAELTHLASEETGRQIKSSPELLNLLDISNEEWGRLKLKTNQAVASAKSNIFRLLNLPLELRYRIYDFAFIAQGPIRYRPWGANSTLGFALAATCKQLRAETLGFFFRNNFKIDLSKEFRLIKTYICDNVQEVSYGWWAFSKKDPQMFDILNYECPKLKVLNLAVASYCVDAFGHRMQWLHRDEPAAKRFRRANGFDALLRIRGLERVNVTKGMTMERTDVTQKEIDDFAAFLNTVLTQPKPDPLTTPMIVKPTKVEVRRLPWKEPVKKGTRRSFDGDGDDGEWPGSKKMRSRKRARVNINWWDD